MINFLWGLLWITLIAIWLLPKEFTYKIDGVEHKIQWSASDGEKK